MGSLSSKINLCFYWKMDFHPLCPNSCLIISLQTSVETFGLLSDDKWWFITTRFSSILHTLILKESKSLRNTFFNRQTYVRRFWEEIFPVQLLVLQKGLEKKSLMFFASDKVGKDQQWQRQSLYNQIQLSHFSKNSEVNLAAEI